MKITPKQLMYLITTLQDSIKIKVAVPDFTFNHECRARILDEIFNQQGDEPIIICKPREKVKE